MVTSIGSLYWWPSVCWWPGPSPSLSSSSCHWTFLPPSSGPDSFIRCTLIITLFDFSNRIKNVRQVINYKTSSAIMVFSICKSVVNRKEPKPQLVISAPAPGGNLIKFRLRIHNTCVIICGTRTQRDCLIYSCCSVHFEMPELKYFPA